MALINNCSNNYLILQRTQVIKLGNSNFTFSRKFMIFTNTVNPFNSPLQTALVWSKTMNRRFHWSYLVLKGLSWPLKIKSFLENVGLKSLVILYIDTAATELLGCSLVWFYPWLNRLCWGQFKHDLRLYASRVPCPCGLIVVYKISPPLNLARWDMRLYWVKLTINQQFKTKKSYF